MPLIQILPSTMRVQIEFPALDRLIELLKADQQKDIDNATKRIKQVSASLKGALQIEEEK